MKIGWVRLFVTVILACGMIWAQQANEGASNTLAYENGSVADNIYTNECFGFSLAIPEGWVVRDGVNDAKASGLHIPTGGVVLLDLKQAPAPKRVRPSITLQAYVAVPSDMTAQEFVSKAVQDRVNAVDPRGILVRKLLHDAYGVDYGGRRFFRADYESHVKKSDLYMMMDYALVFTRFRGYFVGGEFRAPSPDGLDRVANALEKITFQEDQVNPKCVMGLQEEASPPKSDEELPHGVRVAQDVSQGFLIKKVSPEYPQEARQAHIQGTVVLSADIDKNGDIEHLALVSGHPMLAPAAIEAVKQWKYRPYLLNGEPVKVETQITVNFQLSGR